MAIVLHNQTILDLSMQELGSVEYMFEVAMANGLSITDKLAAGNDILIPVIETTSREKETARILQQKRNKPASDDDEPENQLPPSGIGYMKIINPASPSSIDFIVS